MQDKYLARQFGIVIRRLRQEAGMSQEGFALRCGINRAYMGQIERGQKTVTIATAMKVAQGLGLPLSELIAHLERQQRQDDVHS